MPLPVITIAQMREWEKATWAAGQTEPEVIRRVGKSVARQALAMTPAGAHLVILAGKGHNGEDARASRGALEQRRVDVLEVAEPAKDWHRLEALLSLRPALVIDGLFGIGINRPLNADWIKLIELLNHSGVPVLAVDVPSGLNGDTGEPQGAAVRSRVTLTVGAPKRGLLLHPGVEYVGRLEVAAEVGLVPCPLASDVQWTSTTDFNGFPPSRAVATHKGTYGHLAIIAGSVGYHGAAVLTARGAQRAQPGLLTLFTMERSYPPVASQLQAVMVSPWQEEIRLPKTTSALLVGPGLAADDVPEKLKALVRQFWREAPFPVIVDASALAWLEPGSPGSAAVRVVTPHPGEAARMLGTSTPEVQADRFQALRNISSRFAGAWVVLKGHQTLVGRATGEIYVNPSGNPHLAQGGSGDVLSGFIAGLLAQPALQTDPLTALRYAVWQHGATADDLQDTRPNWVVEDLVAHLGSSRPESRE